MYAWLVTGCALNLLAGGLFFLDGTYPVVGQVMLGLALVNVVGVAMVLSGARRPGAIVALVASIGFVPLGLVGIWGARQVLDALSEAEFQRRRDASRSTP